MFYCSIDVGFDNESVKSNNTELTPPYFQNTKKMIKTLMKPAGNTITLRCKAGGYPAPNITWLKDGEVPRRMLGEIKMHAYALYMEDVVTSDSGDYTCIVCNQLGCINFTYIVDVVGKCMV